MNGFKILGASALVAMIGLPGFCDYYFGGSSNTHDMQMIRQQQFRHEEFNDYKDLKEQKEERRKKDEAAVKKIQNNEVRPVNTKESPKFIEKDGKIIIERM